MIVVNEKERAHCEGLTVQQLLVELDPRMPMVSVRINGDPVRRAEWPTRQIEDGDKLLVIPVLGGG